MLPVPREETRHHRVAPRRGELCVTCHTAEAAESGGEDIGDGPAEELLLQGNCCFPGGHSLLSLPGGGCRGRQPSVQPVWSFPRTGFGEEATAFSPMAPLGAVHLAGEEDPRADLLVQAGASSALQ